MTLAFDTLAFTRRLVDAGMERKVAEERATAVRDVAMADLVTKQDLDLALQKLTLKLGGLMAGIVSTAVAVIALLIRFLH